MAFKMNCGWCDRIFDSIYECGSWNCGEKKRRDINVFRHMHDMHGFSSMVNECEAFVALPKHLERGNYVWLQSKGMPRTTSNRSDRKWNGMQSIRMAMIHLHLGTAAAEASASMPCVRLNCCFHFPFAENSIIPDFFASIIFAARMCVCVYLSVYVLRIFVHCAFIKIVMLQLNAETL